MNCKSVFILLILVLSSLASFLRAGTLQDSVGFGAVYMYVQYFHQDEVRPFDVGISFVQTFWNDRLEHNFVLGPFSFVEQGGHNRYSFRFPVALLTLQLVYGIDHLFLGIKQEREMFKSAPYYIVASPNTTLSLKIVDHLQINAGMQTDYLFDRVAGLDRGILFTPIAGLDWFWGKSPLLGSVNVSAGYARFWNFEGPNRNYGWGINLAIFVSAASGD